MPIHNVCVFCGSSPGKSPMYIEAAKSLSELLVSKDIGIVYGGGSLGLMGAIATTAIEKGGRVIGIIPSAMASGMEKPGFSLPGETIIVKDMHSRKALMNEKSDAFIALPGGIGTFEEVLEAMTWSQLSIHTKPIVILNTNGFYEPLKGLIENAIQEGFFKEGNRGLAVFCNTVEEVLDALVSYQPPSARIPITWGKDGAI
ncbi:hypothetical protein HDU99_004400 [Rhizoclosmatium hyalinum]|nr:hypothetical protein HDU99_004400 [Rhizoclosmatium hyalinum]